MTSRLLESIPGDLRAYKELEPDSMLHGYEITTERRTCTDERAQAELRNNPFCTADGQLYTKQKKKVLWGITTLPQNLVLRNIDEAYRQLKETGNYFPSVEEADASFRHADTTVIDLKSLELVKDNDEYGHFEINPQKLRKLNTQQKKVAKRLFGPDEENFGLNMEMLAEAGKSPWVFALMPDYVQRTLKASDKQYLGLASWLYYFDDNSDFNALDRNVGSHIRVRGVRRGASAASQREELPAGRAPEKAGVPSVPSAASEVRDATLEEILEFTRQSGFVAERSWKEYETALKEKFGKK